MIFSSIRYTTRTFRKTPGFTAVVILTLALGIGANAALFSVADALILRPLPFKEADRLVRVTGRSVHVQRLAQQRGVALAVAHDGMEITLR